MFVDHTRKMLFLHNPKCAGASLSDLLSKHHGYEPASPNLQAKVDPSDEGSPIWRHNWTVPNELSNYEVWTTVRHPCRRWESFFNYYSMFNLDGFPTSNNESFKQFTKNRLQWLPPQTSYTDNADFWFPMERMHEGLYELDLHGHFVDLQHTNKTGRFVQWDDESLELVIDYFYDDFRKHGYRLPRLLRPMVVVPL